MHPLSAWEHRLKSFFHISRENIVIKNSNCSDKVCNTAYQECDMIKREEDIWVFPASIDFEKTALYTKKYRDQKDNEIYFFDLSGTRSLHTAFLGFLITVKQDLEKKGGRLILTTSREIEDLFKKMKITDFFTSSKNVEMLRKTA